MQQSWRDDADKLSFIICHPLTGSPAIVGPEDDAPERMIGDINLFLCVEDSEETPQIMGEVELMIPEKKNQRRGFGRATLLAFLRHVVDHESEILGDFVENDPSASKLDNPKLGCLCVKIGEANTGSLALFESLLFQRVSGPNYFGEIELRRVDSKREGVCRGLTDYVELEYGGE